MGKSKAIIISYDISDGKTRAKVRKILKEWRLGGQKSVHECHLKQKQAEELFLQLGALLDEKTDRLLMAWLEPRRSLLCRGTATDNLSPDLMQVM